MVSKPETTASKLTGQANAAMSTSSQPFVRQPNIISNDYDAEETKHYPASNVTKRNQPADFRLNLD